jgi:tight adherence protein B
MALAVAALAFLALFTVILGIWWVVSERRALRARLRDVAELVTADDPKVVRSAPSWLGALLEGTPAYRWLARLLLQAGRDGTPVDLLLVMGTFAILGGFVGWLRTGSLLWGLACASLAFLLPVAYLVSQRYRRLKRFQELFPDALDMMTRSLRAGHALSGAIQLVGDEAPDPVGREFKRVAEEIRLGVDAGEALEGLESRVATEDVQFFATAVRIQRAAGGNLAEILDRLSEVIRERFRLLAHARALSVQHRWSAVVVGVAPVVFAVMAQLLQPRYFDPLLASPMAPYLIGTGIALEIVGFATVWRIANIKV